MHVQRLNMPTSSPKRISSDEPHFEASQLSLLRQLAERPDISQRELSQALGLSLGKTHYVLHALLDKGWIKVRNFRRSDNKRAYAYLLTQVGLKEKLSLTRRFLQQKESEFEQLKAAIGILRAEIDGQPSPSGTISRDATITHSTLNK